MTDKKNYTAVPLLNETHRLEIGIALGLAATVNYLRKADDLVKRTPGFNTALAMAETIEAQQRASVAGSNMRAAVAAGFDLATHMVGLHGRGEVIVWPMDLEELAEFAPSSGPGQ